MAGVTLGRIGTYPFLLEEIGQFPAEVKEKLVQIFEVNNVRRENLPF
ncbi:MAG TPA: hypothetical protein VMR08_01695 [Patescibacteria group bacterium]|jgi:hypothetical protein|nr:hypothetical protein [Patescibacteria group bacterium]